MLKPLAEFHLECDKLRGFRALDHPAFHLRLQFKQVLAEDEFFLGIVAWRIKDMHVQTAREGFLFPGSPALRDRWRTRLNSCILVVVAPQTDGANGQVLNICRPAMAEHCPYSVFYCGFTPDWMVRDYEDVGKRIFPFKPSNAYQGIPEERDLGPYLQGRVGWRPGQICAKVLRDAFREAGVKELLYVEQDGRGHAFNHIRLDEFRAFLGEHLKP